VVRATHGKGKGGIIRLEFPGAPGADDEALEAIGWDEFFERFDESKLALLCQDETAGGQKSNFNKLIGRETADARAHGTAHASRHHPRGR
ncbi:MAG TPA: hypothetical protein VJR70_00950, partial [Stellaceae bacterium]|nr:hypothetical protein [Stellaceae bacterium]